MSFMATVETILQSKGPATAQTVWQSCPAFTLKQVRAALRNLVQVDRAHCTHRPRNGARIGAATFAAGPKPYAPQLQPASRTESALTSVWDLAQRAGL